MTLRVISAEAASGEISMDEAIAAAMRECTAAEPSVVMISWEKDGCVTTRSIPPSVLVEIGFLRALNQVMRAREKGE